MDYQLIKNKTKEYWPYLAVVLAIILPWFFHPGYLFLTDLAWGPRIILDWTNGGFLMSLIIKTLSFIFSVDLLEKLYLGLVLFIALMGGKKVASLFIEDKLAVFVVSLFGLFNPFVYDRLMYGQVNIVLALGLLLLSVGYLLEYLGLEQGGPGQEGRRSRSMILFGLCAGLALQFSTHFVFFIGAVFILFLILYFKKWGTGQWKISLQHVVWAAAVMIILNINWLAAMPLGMSNTANFVGVGITKQDLLAFKTSGSSDSAVLSNVVMMSGFWGKDQYRYTDLTKIKDNWGRSFLLLLPIIIFGITLGIRKKEEVVPGSKEVGNIKKRNPSKPLTIGLLIIFVISVILAAGVALSFMAPLSYWLFDHFPFYKGLRESQKWVSVVVLVYAVFLSIGTAALLKTKVISINRHVSLLFLGAVIIMQTPFVLWGFGGQVRPVQYPADWAEVDKSLECPNNEKILFLPWHMYMSFSWIGHIVANPAMDFFRCPVISGSDMEWGGIYDNSVSQTGKSVGDWLYAKGQTGLLKNNELGVRYILLAKELDWGNYLWLQKSPGLKLIKETAGLMVFERQSP